VEWDREKAAAGRRKNHLPFPTLNRGTGVAQARKRHTDCLVINQIDGMQCLWMRKLHETLRSSTGHYWATRVRSRDLTFATMILQ
jgi:hypothetical protein